MDPLEHFEFSQSSLQDFVDCPKRFKLRYLQHIAWPAIQAEPARENERLIQRGDRFHRLAQQYLMGVPEDRLTRIAGADEDENLLHWWLNFLNHIPTQLEGARFVEIDLGTPFGQFRLVAKYDLILMKPDGRAIIFDWKTSQHKPKRATLLARLQTRVYPYLLVQAGAFLNQGKAIQPDAIEMIYWFAEPDQSPERLVYTPERYQSDDQYLHSLIDKISHLHPEDFTEAETDRPCGYCVYRSLCGRGAQAANLSASYALDDETDEIGDLDINLEEIGEISF